jgi:Glycosyltransferases, probably involved in cell wall biogenesis
MFFSVVISLYNKASYIAKAIESVFAQTFTDFELIIIDDGSTDNSFEMAYNSLMANSSRLTVNYQLPTQPNSGVSTTRNNGVALAKADYVCFLDADDWWAPTFLEEMHKLITEYPDAGIYGTSYFLVKNEKNKVAPIALDNGFEKGYIDYIQVYSRFLCMPLSTGTVCVKKSVFEEMQGFKPQLKIGEDFDLWLRIALKYKVAFVNKQLAYYNQDVELNNRAVGHLYKPEANEVDCYSDYEKLFPENAQLKQLLDNKRVYGLMKYYMSKEYRDFAKMELDKVDWSKQPKSAVRQYNTPIWMLKLRQLFLNVGSRIKQFLKK